MKVTKYLSEAEAKTLGLTPKPNEENRNKARYYITIAEWDGVLSIVDFKTSRKPKKKEWITNYFIQSSFYAAAFFERTGVAITQAVIPITVDHNEPQVFKIKTHDYLPQFLEVRQKYRELKEYG